MQRKQAKTAMEEGMQAYYKGQSERREGVKQAKATFAEMLIREIRERDMEKKKAED